MQAETLAAPRREYGVLARVLFTTLDTLYGKKRTLSKFKVLELVARVPYQAWEHVAYIAITHMHGRTELARRIFDRVRESREQQDNEQWHLLILEERIASSGKHENRLYYFWIPQVIALVYYQLSWLLFVLRPDWSYRLNADFEDHAEHEYMHLVTEHPEWETDSFRRPTSPPTTDRSTRWPTCSARSATTSGSTRRSRSRRSPARASVRAAHGRSGCAPARSSQYRSPSREAAGRRSG